MIDKTTIRRTSDEEFELQLRGTEIQISVTLKKDTASNLCDDLVQAFYPSVLLIRKEES